MTNIAEKFQIIKNSSLAMKQAIIDKGGIINGDITTWANSIANIPTGGTFEPGSGNVKILNKLNGDIIGELNKAYILEELLYAYQVKGNDTTKCFCFSDGGSNITSPNYDIYGSFVADIGFEFYTEYGDSKYRIVGGNSYTQSIYIDNTRNDINMPYNITIKCVEDATKRDDVLVRMMFIAYDTQNPSDFDFDYFTVQNSTYTCFCKNTKISLYNGETKLVQDITYNDELLVWNFDEGKYDKAKPLWIKKEEKSNYFYKVSLDNGVVINLVGANGKCHRLFNIDDQKFEYATDLVDKNVQTLQGSFKVKSIELVEENCDYYNIITKYHMNLFANGILTSCRYNNLYPIKNMKFDKSNITFEPRYKIHEKFKKYPDILPEYVIGMRLDENQNINFEETSIYCNNLTLRKMTIEDFEDNKTIIKTIDESQVGWIDRQGNVYGFKLYMPGQYNHIVLAEKICEMLNIKTDNPFRYLEKNGWVKYTTDFILNSDDEIISDKQIETLKVFLKNNSNKLKTPGKIRIGNIYSPQIDVSEFEKMDVYSFEYKKHNNLMNYNFKEN